MFIRIRTTILLIRMKRTFAHRTSMLQSAVRILIIWLSAAFWLTFACVAQAQTMSDRIVSEHVRMILPMEREWVGRDAIMDVERCWRFVNGFMGGTLPRRILVEINWNDGRTKTDPEGRIAIGMRTPAADFDPRFFIVRSAVRETARLGLLGLGRGTPARGGNDLLLEGMSEIVAREFFHTTRALAGAWVHAQMLDRLKPLSLAQISPGTLPDESHDLRADAAGITFLITCTDLQGRDRTLKLFESLRRGLVLEQGILEAFKITPPALESAWLKRVRAYTVAEGIQATQDEDKPKLDRIQCVPVSDARGTRLQLRVFVRKGTNILLPEGIYAYDEASSRVSAGRAPDERGAQYLLVEIPAEAGKIPPSFSYRIVAIDEGGGVSDWQGSCSPGK